MSNSNRGRLPPPPEAFNRADFEVAKAQIQSEYRGDIANMQVSNSEIWGEIKSIKDNLSERIFQQRVQWATIAGCTVAVLGGLTGVYLNLDNKIENTRNIYIEKSSDCSEKNIKEIKEIIQESIKSNPPSKIQNGTSK
jgi:hypothetical protein